LCMPEHLAEARSTPLRRAMPAGPNFGPKLSNTGRNSTGRDHNFGARKPLRSNTFRHREIRDGTAE
jgi:hypothetical protein